VEDLTSKDLPAWLKVAQGDTSTKAGETAVPKKPDTETTPVVEKKSEEKVAEVKPVETPATDVKPAETPVAEAKPVEAPTPIVEEKVVEAELVETPVLEEKPVEGPVEAIVPEVKSENVVPPADQSISQKTTDSVVPSGLLETRSEPSVDPTTELPKTQETVPASDSAAKAVAPTVSKEATENKGKKETGKEKKEMFESAKDFFVSSAGKTDSQLQAAIDELEKLI